MSTDGYGASGGWNRQTTVCGGGTHIHRYAGSDNAISVLIRTYPFPSVLPRQRFCQSLAYVSAPFHLSSFISHHSYFIIHHSFTFKKELLLDNANSYKVIVKNTDKKSGMATYSVKLTAKELFTKGDNSDDTKAKAKTLAAGKTTNDWVGYGDAVDYYKLGVDAQGGFYDLAISGVKNNVKLTVYSAQGKKLKGVTASAKKPTVRLADLCLANGSYAVVEAPKAAKAQNSDYKLTLTPKAVFTGAKNNDWKSAEVLEKGATFTGALTKAPGGDVVDYCDVSQIDALYFDMTAGKAKVSFFDKDRNKVKVAAVKMANGTGKANVASLTLAAGNAATDHFTIADIDAAVKYLKIEASGKTLNGYTITKIA